MTARVPFKQSDLRRAIKAVEAEGMRVVGVKADGTVIVDRGDNPHPLIPKQTRADARWEDLEV